MKAIIFDWGDTLMRDFPQYKGAMLYWPNVELMSGVKETLAELYNHFILCVASNAGDSNAELMGKALKRADIKSCFRHLFTSIELGCMKPNSRFYEGIIAKLGLTANECIMVGNDYIKDIIPAKKLGMYTVLISDEKESEQYKYADFTIENMSKLCFCLRYIR